MAGLSNTQIDRYLESKVSDMQIIPSNSYQGVFTTSGMLKPSIKDDNWVTVLNMDKINGPGNHWFAMLVYPKAKLVFYYDPLLPNHSYQIPPNLRNFMIKVQEKGWQVIENLEIDQEPIHHHPNDMCGAYAAQMIVLMDQNQDEKPVKAFFEAHKKLMNPGYVSKIFTSIDRGF